MSGLLVVVPAFNEEASVGQVVTDLKGIGHAVLVIDDASKDATSIRAVQAGAQVVRLPINLGVGGALRCGFRYAIEHGYTMVVQCDADGQHPADQIERLLAAHSNTRAHIVLGSRFGASGWRPPGRIRTLTISLLSKVASRAAGTKITDATSGFRLISEPLLSAFAREFPANYLGDTFEALVSAGRRGYHIVEIPVEMRARAQGESTASLVEATKFLLRSVIVVAFRLHVPLPPNVTGSARGGDAVST